MKHLAQINFQAEPVHWRKHAGWLWLIRNNRVATLWMIMFLSSLSLRAQCQLNCRHGDPLGPLKVAIDSAGWVTLRLDSLLYNPASCPGAKQVAVYDSHDKRLATDTLSGVADTMAFRPAVAVGEVCRVMITDIGSSFFCEGFIRPFDAIAPVIRSETDTVTCIEASHGAGIKPEITDNWGPVKRVTNEDAWMALDCVSGFLGKITRTWTAVDSSGNSSRVDQVIWIRQPDIRKFVFPADTVFNCGSANVDLNLLGKPILNGESIPEEGFCYLQCDYLVDTVALKNTADRKIVRTWTILDQCTNLIVTGKQTIVIRDLSPPVLTCPKDLVVRTLSNRCYANVKLPAPQISDNCDPFPLMTVTTSFGGIGLGEHQYVGVGVHSVRYEVRDASGNTQACTIRLTIADEEEPTAVCNESAVVAVPSGGYARVYASSLDEGSYDNCKSQVYFKTRRLEPEACDGANGDDSNSPGYQEWFDDYAVFCCEEVGRKDIPVILRVYEIDPGPGPVNPVREVAGGDLFGHFSECVVLMEVQDNIPPALVCPDNRTVECTDGFFDLAVFGSPAAADRCGGFALDSSVVRNINNCGAGLITRTWTATDAAGNRSSCTQRIEVVNSRRLEAAQIRWPQHYTVEQCGGSLEPENLPPGFDKPVTPDEACLLAGISHKDQVYSVSGSGCFEILREWTVIDLCHFDPLYPDEGGRFTYLQRIRVTDNRAPALTTPPDTVVSLATDCERARVKLALATATDACSPQVTIRNDSPFADAAGADASGYYPLGTTEFTFTAVDQCGNQARNRVQITVVDGKAPAPVCLGGLTATLSRMDQGNMVVVNAKAFDASTVDPCGGALRFAVRRAGSADPAPPSASELVFTCADLGRQAVELWVFDQHGNGDYCETGIEIKDNNNLCNPAGGPADNVGLIAGDIFTEDGVDVEEVKVRLNSSQPMECLTGADGYYELPDVPLGKDYTLMPEKNNDLMNGISTLDLVLMSKHILGLNRLNSPYRIIAADIDRSGSISTLDLIRLRKLILGIQDGLPHGNTSWRFIDAAYKFPDPANPFLEDFPEIRNLNDFHEGAMFANFIGIKVGDVNNSSRPNSLSGVDGRATNGRLVLQTGDRQLRPGETVEVDITADGLDQILGYQFTLACNPQLVELIDLHPGDVPGLTLDNFNLGAREEGIITTSWNEMTSPAPPETAALLHLTLRAHARAALSEALNLTSNPTVAEAYDRQAAPLKLELSFGPENKAAGGLKVLQNQPNPFRSSTLIAFELPQTAETRLTVHDVSGKKIYQREENREAGYNEFEIFAADLPASGLLYYTLEAAGESTTRKMILIT